MKQLLLLALVILSAGCTYNQRPINQTSEPNNNGKRVILYNTHDKGDWYVVQGSDGHEYMENYMGTSYVLIHYPDCVKCSKKDTIK